MGRGSSDLDEAKVWLALDLFDVVLGGAIVHAVKANDLVLGVLGDEQVDDVRASAFGTCQRERKRRGGRRAHAHVEEKKKGSHEAASSRDENVSGAVSLEGLLARFL